MPTTKGNANKKTRARGWLWFAGIYLGSLGLFLLAVYVLKLLMGSVL